jgi:hypothetical protein
MHRRVQCSERLRTSQSRLFQELLNIGQVLSLKCCWTCAVRLWIDSRLFMMRERGSPIETILYENVGFASSRIPIIGV